MVLIKVKHASKLLSYYRSHVQYTHDAVRTGNQSPGRPVGPSISTTFQRRSLGFSPAIDCTIVAPTSNALQSDGKETVLQQRPSSLLESPTNVQPKSPGSVLWRIFHFDPFSFPSSSSSSSSILPNRQTYDPRIDNCNSCAGKTSGFGTVVADASTTFGFGTGTDFGFLVVLESSPSSSSSSSSSSQQRNHSTKYDIVVSNPPYIPRHDMNTLEPDVISYESDGALCGGDDGLDVIRTIIEKLPDWCHSGSVCWMEVDTSHPKLIQEMLAESHDDGDNDTNFLSPVLFHSSHMDMFGRDRFVKLVVR